MEIEPRSRLAGSLEWYGDMLCSTEIPFGHVTKSLRGETVFSTSCALSFCCDMVVDGRIQDVIFIAGCIP